MSASLKSRSGPGVGTAGDRYIATIQPDSDDDQVLYMHRIGVEGQGFSFCTLADGG
jgi:hypothetical protein